MLKAFVRNVEPAPIWNVESVSKKCWKLLPVLRGSLGSPSSSWDGLSRSLFFTSRNSSSARLVSLTSLACFPNKPNQLRANEPRAFRPALLLEMLCGACQAQQATQVCECHTRLSEENQVHTYMHSRIKFHAYIDIKVYKKTISRKKKKDYQRFTLNPGNEGTKHHRQSTGSCVRLAPTTSSQDFKVASFFWATMLVRRVGERMNAEAL
jgi:hypothetical protein